jgi:hypothetical protein
MSSSQCIQSEVLFVNLKVLSRLQPFERINTRSTHFTINNNTSTGYVSKYLPDFVSRWWSGSTRESDLTRVRDLYVETIMRINENHDDAESLRCHLKESLIGLESLKKTYEDDTTMICRLETLMEQASTK